MSESITRNDDRISRLTPLQQATLALKTMRRELDRAEALQYEPVAVVGMACRFPGGVNSPEEYWNLLSKGVNAVTEVPAERWDVNQYYDPDPNSPGKSYARHGAFLRKIEWFDPHLFGISPREAHSIDPQQRLLLEVSWEALEHSAHAPDRLRGGQTGVFIGIAGNEYLQILRREFEDLGEMDAYAGTGNLQSAAAGRIAFLLGLHGPAIVVDTACSSSLVSVQLACQSLRSHGCDLALAGGVNLMLSPEASVFLCRGGALSPDGRCKTFDALADGYVRGEGCGIVVLKRLSDAVASGNRILALVRGAAVNHDGSSSGFTVPNGLAQEAVIRKALDNARVDPLEISYVEAHGTGTSLGDPIEMRALAAVLCTDRPAGAPLAVGSVKTNIGHLESAAGIASLIKVVLALQHKEIPPHLHFRSLNPHIELNGAPVRIPLVLQPWESSKRIACVGAFGLSGTNCHAVVEEAPPVTEMDVPEDCPAFVLPLSARNEKSARELAARFADHLDRHPGDRLDDVCRTAGSGRSHFQHRLVATAQNSEEMRDRLTAAAAGAQSPGVIENASSRAPLLAFLFTGQGSQYARMGRQLYDTQPVFRSALERCSDGLGPIAGRSLLSVIFPTDGDDEAIHQTIYTQPALFSIEFALTELWRSWGIQPSAVMGHSVGEYVAACVAGAVGLEDALRLILKRAELMHSLPPGGAMASIYAGEKQVAEAMRAEASRVSIAALNGPSNTVISGDRASVIRICQRLEQIEIRCQLLNVSNAFHSPLMDPVLDEFEREAGQCAWSEPGITLVSNLTGDVAPSLSPGYWRRHLREAVRFQHGVQTLERLGYRHFLEIGPTPVLVGMARGCVTVPLELAVSSLRRGRPDWPQMMESLAALYSRGAAIDWQRVNWHASRNMEPRHSLALPFYPFQRERYWIDNPKRNAASTSVVAADPDARLHPYLGVRLNLPFSNQVRFERRFSRAAPEYLTDHRLFGVVVTPGASHLCMAISAAEEIFGPSPCVLEDVVFSQPMTFADDDSRIVQVVVELDAGAADSGSFQVVSKAVGEDSADPGNWILHCSGKVNLDRGPDSGLKRESLAAMQDGCPVQSGADDFYAEYAKFGYNLGPSFQWINRIWRGQGRALVRMEHPTGALEGHYRLHPGLLDSCFQALACGYAAGDSGDAALAPDSISIPFSIARLRFRGGSPQPLWCHAALRPPNENAPGSSVGDISLFGEEGESIVEVGGLYGRQTTRSALARAQRGGIASWLYKVEWKAMKRTFAPAASARDKWLIVGSKDDAASAPLAALVVERGGEAILALAGGVYRKIDAANYQIDLARPEDYRDLLADISKADAGPLRGVIHIASLAADIDSLENDAGAEAGQSVSSVSLLLLFQAAVAAGSFRPASGIWVITRGAQPVRTFERLPGLSQAPVWGLGRVIAQEQPDLFCGCMDLDPESSLDSQMSGLADELFAPAAEREVALRRGERYVPRLVRAVGRAKEAEKRPVRLESVAPGVLDQLALISRPRERAAAGEIEIRICASGLNFRDVLNALGMYPGNAGPLGGECAGTVASVGEGVTGFQPGDRVVALAAGSFSTFVTAPAVFSVPLPEALTFEQAATIPIAFLTAHYGLNYRARMRPGARVLIHAATGGVGLAAVQLAMRAGAEIFATAGSPEKREFLRGMGISHVMDSRSLHFAAEIMTITNGEGIDIILNSLAGEFIPKGLSILRSGGWFLEIGKRDLLDQEQVDRKWPGIRYEAFDLAEIGLNRTALLRSMFEEIVGLFASGDLRPLPTEIFPLEEASSAFRFMAQARHIGKIVLSQTHEMDLSNPVSISAEATYLITGGQGALGLEIGRWLATRGARNLVLLSRKPAGEAASEAIRELREQGVRVVEAQTDVSRVGEVAPLFAEVREQLPPLRGIVHAAGILDDGILPHQTPQRFASVMAPKIGGAWNLHRACEGMPLDFFVVFSSTAAVFGSPGQGNYAAANAFLDSLAHYRRGLGLPGLSIDWGPWGSIGMAAADRDRERKWKSQGIGMIAPDQGVQAFEELLGFDCPQVLVAPVQWPQLARRFSGSLPPFLSLFASNSTAPGKKEVSRQDAVFLAALAKAPEKERPEMLISFIQTQIVHVLGLAPSHVFDPRQPLSELGLDSLMAVELRNALGNAIGRPLPATVLFDFPTIEGLATYVIDKVLGLGLATGTSGKAPPARETNPEVEAAIAAVAQLSEEDVQQSLRAAAGIRRS